MSGSQKRIVLLVGTRKGAFLYHGDASRTKWEVDGPHLLGSQVHHLVMDPRDGRTLLMAARTGHLGPTIFRSTDNGRTWSEAKQPPAFPESGDKDAPAVDHTFWLEPGHPDSPNVWWAGTSPPGLFRSDDAGVSWEGIEGFNQGLVPRVKEVIGDIPDGPIAHSIQIDPRDAEHMYIGISTGGIFETTDGGNNWNALNKGVAADFLPIPEAEVGHDPHCIQIHPAAPDRLYHQNHCGIYRLDRPSETWERIGNNMPKEIGDIGFPIVLHPRDPDTAWVFPMDGTTVWPRTSVDGKPAAYRTRDGGQTWEKQDSGLPREHAWFTVRRQSFAADSCEPLGLYFGTTSGEIWMSDNEGGAWRPIVSHLPMIFSVVAATITA